MKKSIFIALLAILNFAANAQDTAKADAKLITATVYYGYGAELTHETKVNVSAGIKQIVINHISTTIDENSLQISVPENITLLSQKYQVIYPQAPVVVNPVVKVLQDSITSIHTTLRRYDNLIGIEEQTLEKTGKLIESAIANSGNEKVQSDEVLKLVNAYNTKIEKSKTNIFNYTETEKILNDKIILLQNKITEASKSPIKADKPYGQLTLQVICTSKSEAPISFSYFTTTAGWTPLYDIRVNSKTNELKLVYKASVTQTTGIDWKQTKLTLSTGNPSLGGAAPILNAWYLQLYVPAIYNDVSSALQGRIAGVSVQNSIQSIDKEEIMATGYGVAKVRKDLTGSIPTVDPSTLQQFTTLNESQLNTNFEIDLPYDIESDGQLHVVNIKEEKINPNLKNYAVPKLDKDAYLLAEVTDWQNLDLLPGTANIIMDNTYLGKSFIDPNSTADTLNLSLGKDRRVAIKRTAIKDFTTLKTKGNATSQTFTYEITVKNNKLTTVDLLLKDQYPISSVTDIEVALNDDGKADVNKELGILNWKLQLKPGESQKVRFSYTVKYPKDKKIANL
jgi:uncharacterized protein (TIGR02231 family)